MIRNRSKNMKRKVQTAIFNKKDYVGNTVVFET